VTALLPYLTLAVLVAAPSVVLWPMVRPMPADPWEAAALQAFRRDQRATGGDRS
jgi:hypothetical protein